MDKTIIVWYNIKTSFIDRSMDLANLIKFVRPH